MAATFSEMLLSAFSFSAFQLFPSSLPFLRFYGGGAVDTRIPIVAQASRLCVSTKPEFLEPHGRDARATTPRNKFAPVLKNSRPRWRRGRGGHDENFSQFRAHGGFRFAGAVDIANRQFERALSGSAKPRKHW